MSQPLQFIQRLFNFPGSRSFCINGYQKSPFFFFLGGMNQVLGDDILPLMSP
jgi:hypothetical protein